MAIYTMPSGGLCLPEAAGMTIQIAELVAARVICLPSSTDATRWERKSCSQSIGNLVDHLNGYLRARNRSF